jgi:hypothetical protein
MSVNVGGMPPDVGIERFDFGFAPVPYLGFDNLTHGWVTD